MNIKKAILGLGVAYCCIALSGCFYLRLQKVKDQLTEFDTYFEIKEGERFSLIAKKPVLLATDVVRILEKKPSAETAADERLLYDYVFEKQYAQAKDEVGNYDITITFAFTNGKLTECYIDKRFFAVIPKEMFIAALKGVGSAQVDIEKRRLSGGHGGEAVELHLPDSNEVQLLLGQPYSKQGNVYTYKYIRRLPNVSTRGAKDLLPVVITFDEKGRFLKCSSKLLGGTVECDFSKFVSKKEQAEAMDASSTKSNEEE